MAILRHRPSSLRGLAGLLALWTGDLYLRFRASPLRKIAETAQASTMHDIQACLGEAWSEAGGSLIPALMSSCTDAGRPLSITLEHVTRPTRTETRRPAHPFVRRS